MSSIKILRESMGLTQSQFGKYFYGIPLRTVQSWESGERHCPEYVERLIIEEGKRNGFDIVSGNLDSIKK